MPCAKDLRCIPWFDAVRGTSLEAHRPALKRIVQAGAQLVRSSASFNATAAVGSLEIVRGDSVREALNHTELISIDGGTVDLSRVTITS
jgi:hypothetical protein